MNFLSFFVSFICSIILFLGYALLRAYNKAGRIGAGRSFGSAFSGGYTGFITINDKYFFIGLVLNILGFIGLLPGLLFLSANYNCLGAIISFFGLVFSSHYLGDIWGSDWAGAIACGLPTAGVALLSVILGIISISLNVVFYMSA